MASVLHPQHIIDFNYSGGSFELAHKGDALIRESLWPPACIPNTGDGLMAQKERSLGENGP
jgi:hypothetical protein